jgi:hypothetical protein
MTAARTNYSEIAVALAEIKAELDHLKTVIGDEPGKGLRGDVADLVAIKNKGWGLFAGVLLVIGSVGAGVQATITGWLK